MNVVLTGFMGVGKSTVGKIIANRLGLEFVDTDEEIEKNYNMTIPEIFEKFGEPKFREFETETIKNISQKDGCIISCGGGVVKSETNMNFLKANGKVVNLYASVDKIIENIGDDANRPLIFGKSKEEIVKLMESREEFYKNCHIRIDVTEFSAKEAADRIISALEME